MVKLLDAAQDVHCRTLLSGRGRNGTFQRRSASTRRGSLLDAQCQGRGHLPGLFRLAPAPDFRRSATRALAFSLPSRVTARAEVVLDLVTALVDLIADQHADRQQHVEAAQPTITTGRAGNCEQRSTRRAASRSPPRRQADEAVRAWPFTELALQDCRIWVIDRRGASGRDYRRSKLQSHGPRHLDHHGGRRGGGGLKVVKKTTGRRDWPQRLARASARVE